MDDWGAWEPMAVAEVVDLLGGLERRWWVAGGWSIDLHLGAQTRPHADTDVLVMRADLPALRAALAGWDLHGADPPGSLRPWRDDEVLPLRVHDVWCRPSPTSPWRLQVMVDEATDGVWSYRRDPRIERLVAELEGPASTPGLRVLAPEIQLLHKSKDPRPKDEADFRAVLPHLDEERRAWLRAALLTVDPRHSWLDRL